MSLSTQPPKGTSDRYPDEMRVRKYIFDTWRRVCISFGYQEYLGPLVEDVAIREAKSGEDVGGSELTRLTDREGKISDLALRPEMTPTVTRMVTAQYRQLSKPIRWFSIANFYRNERPQRGRNREFWQLNVDMFGDRSERGLVEILQLGMELMLAFDPPEDSWKLSLNHRGLIDAMLVSVGIASDAHASIIRIMDKYHKLPQAKFVGLLKDTGLDEQQVKSIYQFLGCETVDAVVSAFPSLADHASIHELQSLIASLEKLGYGSFVMFDGSLMRGFDYYDGVVFEVFDRHPENNRALFGGGRYDGLASIFGSKDDIPAVGFAPGDETMKLFLEAWDLLDDVADMRSETYYYLPLVDDSEEVYDRVQQIAADLRSYGHRVETDLSTKKVSKALHYADKISCDFVILVFAEETKIKNMQTGEEDLYS